MEGINSNIGYFDNEFQANGIIGLSKVTLSNKNLIIGENGSGKTRFLKTIEHIYEINNDRGLILLTLYFPYITNTVLRENNKKSEGLEPDPPPFICDLLRGNADPEISDFLQTILNAEDRYEFISSLFTLTEIRAPKERDIAKAQIQKYNSIMHTFVNREFAEVNGTILVNKYSEGAIVRTIPLENAFNPNEISPGELMLFYFSLLISYLSIIKDKKVIIIIDEPEQHLHPQKQIEVLKWLLEAPIVSEIWVATHSIFLIPYFEFDQIILLSNHNIVPRDSKLYLRTVESLLGQENLDVFGFMNNQDAWLYNKFIMECFFDPKVVGRTVKNDEQVTAVLRKIKANHTGRPLNIMDYGAGKARFWECFKMEVPDPADRRELMRYRAYEPNPPEDFIYDSSIAVYDSLKEVFLKTEKEDVVLLLNVLHEIPLNHWEETFKRINFLLAENGYLIIVETKTLSCGEQPNGVNGYILLDQPEMKILFKNAIVIDDDRIKRSNVWVISKEDLNSITTDQISNCLIRFQRRIEIMLKREYEKKLESQQNKGSTNMSPRAYAFYSQQYINLKFAIDLYMRNKQEKNP